jgi:hypothetical protein
MHDGISPLLTPKEVADLLKISLQTVYDNRKLLRGFCPAGIRVLRFRKDDIERIMEGPRNQIVKAEIRDDRWAELRGRRIQNQKRRPGQKGRKTVQGQEEYRRKLEKSLRSFPLFRDCKLLSEIQQTKQKDGKKES